MLFLLFTIVSCSEKIERSGIVVDRHTNKPLKGVSIDIYMKFQKRDSLAEKVFTDNNGYFKVKELRDENLLFAVRKSGYIGFVSSLSVENDTIRLKRESIVK